MQPITAAELQHIAPPLSAVRATAIAPLLNGCRTTYQIDSPLRLSAFLGTILEESGLFSRKDENLNYSAARIHEVWPVRFPTIALAQPYAHNPRALANKVYAGRLGNGDEKSGDGYRFRGAGFIQLTGRALFAAYAHYRGQDIAAIAEQLRTDDATALDSAGWYFTCYRKLLPVADSGDFKQLTRLVNGGYTNMAIREQYYLATAAVFA